MLTGRTILPLNGQKEVFLNIGEIYALNFDLLQELEDRVQNWCAIRIPVLYGSIQYMYVVVLVHVGHCCGHMGIL